MTTSIRFAVRALLVAGALFAVACGGGAAETREETTTPVAETPPPAVPAHARGSDTVTARVGTRGGTLELANGSRLEIPAGALEREVEITMRVAADGQAFEDRELRRPLSAVVEILPQVPAAGGQRFRLSMPAQPIPDGFERSDLALGHETDDTRGRPIGTATHTRWDMWPARIEGERFVSDLDMLAGHRMQFGVSR